MHARQAGGTRLHHFIPNFSIFFLFFSVSISIDGEYFCLEKLKGVWLGQSSVIIKLIFCWKSLFPGHLSLFSEDASLPLSKTRTRLSIRTFPLRLNTWHHYCSPDLGFPTLLEVDEGPRLYFLRRSSIHTWPVDSCCLWSPKTGRCVHIKCWVCTDCNLSSLLATSKHESSSWPFLLLHGALNEAVEK